jgi:hypothetical protein
MPPDREKAPQGPPSPGSATNTPGPKQEAGKTEHNRAGQQSGLPSRQVSWWDVHQYVTPLLDQLGSWPMAGTPAWCDLHDADPVKLAALFDAAQHWALRLETCQRAQEISGFEAHCQATRDISAAANWSALAQAITARRNSAYIPREDVA